MGNRKYKVHITYKHNDAHKSGIEAIKVGLDTHKIPYSIPVGGINLVHT